MREWLFGLAPLAVGLYFVFNPDKFAALLYEARVFLH
jgi:hypothetical protein